MLRIGLISDTHGLWRAEAERVLRGCDHIVHGGDIGGPEILQRLAALAPLTAVRGNNDTGGWAKELPVSQFLEFGGVGVFVLHDLKELAQHPAAAAAQVIVCGHSHKPLIARQASGAVVVNPGSAGPRRFSLPVSAGELLIRGPGDFAPKLITLL